VNWEVFVTCAVTGAGATVERSPQVPVTPEAIAAAAVDAAEAGAAVVHIHVRDPETGRAARDPALYRDVVEREICTLDCGSMNFAAGGDYVMVNTPEVLRAMARRVQELGVRPELEVFDTGHMVLVKELIADGLIDGPPLIQLCTGIPYGAPDDPATLLAMVQALPPTAVFSAFAIGRKQLPFVAMAALVGGNVRVGLEDNLYLSRGVLATNGQLVERAIRILEAMNVRVLGPDEVRERLRLTRHA
jgi:uncharacterized protein (DUF849 family)